MKAIMYHYVRPFNELIPNLKHLHIDDFRLQLDLFEQEYGFVSKEAFLDSLQTGNVPQGVVLTFDDGLKCHYDFVFHELKRRGLWGIFYVPTGMYVTGKIIDVHRIHILLGVIDSERVYNRLAEIITDELLTDAGKAEFKEETYKVQQNDNYTLLVKRILNYYISYEHRERIIDELIEHFELQHFDDVASFYVNDEELKEMHDHGMIIGSHTVNHPVLSKLDASAQEREIADSFTYLENVCGRFAMKTFCYPYGGFHSFTDETEAILSGENCLFSFNVEHRDVAASDLLKRPQALPRYDCNQFEYGKCR